MLSIVEFPGAELSLSVPRRVITYLLAIGYLYVYTVGSRNNIRCNVSALQRSCF